MSRTHDGIAYDTLIHLETETRMLRNMSIESQSIGRNGGVVDSFQQD